MTSLTAVLDISADIAAILTAVVAVQFYVALQIGRYTQRRELSAYLKNLPADKGGATPPSKYRRDTGRSMDGQCGRRAKTSASMIGGTDIATHSSFGRCRFNRLSVQL
ncbi:MAG TPA: hypothetical protein VEU94_02850 [Terriglobales bacterium]|nr:hypothetical protein [Terriglobales bacterium]